MKKSILVMLLCFVSVLLAQAQHVAIKTNLMYGGVAQTPNLGLEVRLGERVTIEVSGGYNWFHLDGSEVSNKKRVHLVVQPELRYWWCEGFNGHFVGLHVLGSMYNVSEHRLRQLFGADSEKYRFEGWAAGAGISYGYHLPFSRHWGAEFSLGGGYAYLQYDKYLCHKCGKRVQRGATKHYFGVTRAAVSLIYTF